MRPYNPDNASAGAPSADWQASDDRTDNPGNASNTGSDPTIACQDVDYTYNSSLDMEGVAPTNSDTTSTAERGTAGRVGEVIPGAHDANTISSSEVEPAPTAKRVWVVPAHAVDVTPDKAQSGPGSFGGADSVSRAENSDNPEKIRAGIEQTRSQMSATIDAIQDRLNPQNLVDQAKGAVRDATIGRVENMVNDVRNSAQEAGNGLLGTIKDNPVPAALAAIGIGWLFMKNRNNSPNNYRYGPYDRYDSYDNYGRYGNRSSNADYNRSGGPGEMIGNAQDKVGDVAGQVGSTIGGAAGQVRDSVGNVAGSVGDAAGSLVSNAQQKAGDLGSGVQSGARQAQNSLQRMLYENPLAVGGAALVVGAAIGMMLPETQPEHKLMGEAKANVMDKAQAVAQDTMDKVSRVAQQVGDTVQQEAQNQGLTS